MPILRSRWASCKSPQPPLPAAHRVHQLLVFRTRHLDVFIQGFQSRLQPIAYLSRGCVRMRRRLLLRLSRLVAAAAAAAVSHIVATLMTASSITSALRSASIVAVSRHFGARCSRIAVAAGRSRASLRSTSFGLGAQLFHLLHVIRTFLSLVHHELHDSVFFRLKWIC